MGLLPGQTRENAIFNNFGTGLLQGRFDDSASSGVAGIELAGAQKERDEENTQKCVDSAFKDVMTGGFWKRLREMLGLDEQDAPLRNQISKMAQEAINRIGLTAGGSIALGKILDEQINMPEMVAEMERKGVKSVEDAVDLMIRENPEIFSATTTGAFAMTSCSTAEEIENFCGGAGLTRDHAIVMINEGLNKGLAQSPLLALPASAPQLALN